MAAARAKFKPRLFIIRRCGNQLNLLNSALQVGWDNESQLAKHCLELWLLYKQVKSNNNKTNIQTTEDEC